MIKHSVQLHLELLHRRLEFHIHHHSVYLLTLYFWKISFWKIFFYKINFKHVRSSWKNYSKFEPFFDPGYFWRLPSKIMHFKYKHCNYCIKKAQYFNTGPINSILVPTGRIELSTYWLRISCSTIWAMSAVS